MSKRFSSLRGRPSGQTLAEFGKVSAVFFLVLFGIVQMGLVVYRYNTVSMAAREAARYAIVHSPAAANSPCPSYGCAACSGVSTAATKYAPFLSGTEITVCFSADPNIPTQYDAVVKITHNYTQHIPLMSAVPLTLTSTSKMLVSD
jgi:Flp pilus assembly protein TadG